MARRPLICGNWKMHKTIGDAVALVREISTGLVGSTTADVSVAPPFTSLGSVANALAGGPILLAAQNCHWERQGAFTGEVSPQMLKDVGCAQVILGHSERRQLFGETDEGVARKTRAVLSAQLTPIVCVGETLAEREQGKTLDRVAQQLTGALGTLSPEEMGAIVIAYEPVWAIGTGKTATPSQAQEVHALIRAWMRDRVGGVSEGVRILYGGSVKPEGAKTLLAEKDIDGALVGGASLEAKSFVEIVRSAL